MTRNAKKQGTPTVEGATRLDVDHLIRSGEKFVADHVDGTHPVTPVVLADFFFEVLLACNVDDMSVMYDRGAAQMSIAICTDDAEHDFRINIKRS